jgi:glycosyltransferase involved in cell wall biosynthesis
VKIGCITNTALDPALGSGKTVLEWSGGLRKLGHCVFVVSPNEFYRPFPRRYLHRLKMRWDACRLTTSLLKDNFDLIEFYGGEFGWLASRLKRHKYRPMLVAHTNGLELLADQMFSQGRPAGGAGLRTVIDRRIDACNLLAFSAVDRFVGICSLDTDFLIAKDIQPLNSTATIEPGLDPEFLNSQWQRPKEDRLAYTGTWTPRKNIKSLSRIITSLLADNNDLQIDLLGTGGSPDEILSHFPPSMHRRIKIHPRLGTTQMAEILERAKVFLFPSLYEGFGMATAEAMACGCASVTTPTGFGGTLRSGVEAFIHPFDDEEGMAKSCLALLTNETVRLRIVAASRKRVSGMTWQRQVRRLEEVYNQWFLEFSSFNHDGERKTAR